MMLSAIQFFSQIRPMVTIERNGVHFRGCCKLLRKRLMKSAKKRKKEQGWKQQPLEHSRKRGKQRKRSEKRYHAICNSLFSDVQKIVTIE